MRKMLLYFASLILLSFVLFGCSSTDTYTTNQSGETANYKDISSDQLKSMMKTNNNLLVVDVRENDEFNQGHIPGSILLPTSEIESKVNELPKDKSIALVCATGARSRQVAGYLIQLGYMDVYNLSEGLSNWSYQLVK